MGPAGHTHTHTHIRLAGARIAAVARWGTLVIVVVGRLAIYA